MEAPIGSTRYTVHITKGTLFTRGLCISSQFFFLKVTE